MFTYSMFVPGGKANKFTQYVSTWNTVPGYISISFKLISLKRVFQCGSQGRDRGACCEKDTKGNWEQRPIIVVSTDYSRVDTLHHHTYY